MSLLDLPSELLIAILEQLGPCFFRENTSRLLVSRRWFIFAHEVLLSGLSLSTTCLDGFLSAAENDHFAEALEKSVRSVDLRVLNSDDEALQSIVHDLSPPDTVTLSWMQQRLIDDSVRSKYQADLSVPSLANVLHRCKRTRRLRIYTSCPRSSTFWNQPLNDISFHGVEPSGITNTKVDLSSLLLLSHLTDLEIDTGGTGLEGTTGHLCIPLQRILTNLKRLVLRVDTMCHQALDPPQADVVLPLEELTINLNIDRSPAYGITPYTRWCGKSYGPYRNPWPPSPDLGLALAQQAGLLVKRMRKPRTVRILWQNYKNMHLFETDVLTNTTRSLGEIARCDVQGKAIEPTRISYIGSIRNDFLLFYSEYRRMLHSVDDVLTQLKSRKQALHH